MSAAERAAAGAALLLLAACAAGPRTTVVLLESPDGAASRVEVTGGGQRVALDRPYQAVESRAGGAVPGQPHAMSGDEVRRRFGAAMAAQPEPPALYVLYFRFDTAELDDDSRARLPAILAEIRRRKAPDVGVVGHADRAGRKAVNDRVALERAQAVRRLIEAAGLDPRASVEVTSHGENDPIAPTADGVPEPRNRRVEVSVR